MKTCRDYDILPCFGCREFGGEEYCVINTRFVSLISEQKNNIKRCIISNMNSNNSTFIRFKAAIEMHFPQYLDTLNKILLLK